MSAFCPAPWIKLTVFNTGEVTPCCYLKQDVVGNLHAEPLAEILDGDKLRELRGRFAAGRPPAGCEYCDQLEPGRGPSPRKWLNARFPGVEPGAAPALRALDVHFSNVCNFSCRTCSPALSSSWEKDYALLHGKRFEHFNPRGGREILEAVRPLLPGLELIHFVGGEPLLQLEQYEVLDELLRLGRTDIALSYNTNLSVLGLGSRRILDYWSRFREVRVSVSIDGTGAHGEYVRQGLDWKVFTQNLAALRTAGPQVVVGPCVTVSSLNVFRIPALLDRLFRHEPLFELANINLSYVEIPPEYSIKALPAPLKEQVRQAYLGHIDACLGAPGNPRAAALVVSLLRSVLLFMEGALPTSDFERFVATTRQLDRIRGQSFLEHAPEFAPFWPEPLS